MIDWKHVHQLAADVGAGEFTEIATLFLDEMDSEIAAMKSCDNRDPAALSARMHFLKGSAYYLGFTGFGNLCAAYEAELRTHKTPNVDLAALIAAYQRSREQFISEAPSHSLTVSAA